MHHKNPISVSDQIIVILGFETFTCTNTLIRRRWCIYFSPINQITPQSSCLCTETSCYHHCYTLSTLAFHKVRNPRNNKHELTSDELTSSWSGWFSDNLIKRIIYFFSFFNIMFHQGKQHWGTETQIINLEQLTAGFGWAGVLELQAWWPNKLHLCSRRY